MTDGSVSDRLAQLKSRWESDPSSRIFLQLAEEYRHQGRIQEALAVLDRGLQEHPGYLSALVAKGRCHLEAGEAAAARTVLERVVKQDATQMVANKLLVRAYLDTGDPARARERLDLYSLLNDSDTEIGDLRRQIKLMDRPKEQLPEDSLFDLGPVKPVADDIFDLGDSSMPVTEDIFSLEPPPAPPVAVEPAVDEPDDGDLFPGLASRSIRERYLASLASEGIFELSEAPLAPPPVAAVPEPGPPPVEDASWLEEIPVLPSLPEPPASEPPAPERPVFEELAPLPVSAPVEVQEAAADLWADEEEITPLPELPDLEPPPMPAAQPVATVTLGELYLRQGHADEAERIFREILEREPGNGAALAGLGRIDEARRKPTQPVPQQAVALDAERLLAGFSGSGTTARKVFLLSRYLDRIRGSRNVS